MKKNDTENKDPKEDKNVKKKDTESKDAKEEKNVWKKDKESKNKEKEVKNKANDNNSPREKLKIYILGDSMIKVRSFSGAKVGCIVDHVKPSLRDDKSDHVILRTGTNDLHTESQIAKSIMDLTTSLKSSANQ